MPRRNPGIFSALERLRKTKEDGVSHADVIESDEEDALPKYDENDLNREELMEADDFVVGDDMGYAETGEDLYDLDNQDRQKHKEKKKKKEKRRRDRNKRKKAAGAVKKHFSVKSAQVETTPALISHTKEETADFMKDLLGSDDEEDQEMAEPQSAPLQISVPIPEHESQKISQTPFQGEEMDVEMEEPLRDLRAEDSVADTGTDNNSSKISSNIKKAFGTKKLTTPTLFSSKKFSTPTFGDKVKTSATPVFGSVKKTPSFKPAKKAFGSTTGKKRFTPKSFTPKQKFGTPQESSEPPKKKRKLENKATPSRKKPASTYSEMENGCIAFYMTGAYEDMYKNPGVVFLFGRRAIPGTSETESCCIVVKNILRNLYVLPKETIDGESRFDFMETAEELFNMFRSRKIEIKVKKEKRKFCFLGADELPDEAEYVNLRYPFQSPLLLKRIEEEKMTFRNVYGTKSSAKEVLILECGLQGPGWLKIKGELNQGGKSTWCKSEYIIQKDSQKCIEAINGDLYSKAPALKVMTMALQTKKNKTKQDELVAISLKIHDHFLVDEANDLSGLKTINLCCRLWDQKWAPEFETQSKNIPNLKTFANEKIMLNALTSYLVKEDPDVICGHSFFNFGLEVLLLRMRANRVTAWSKLGRMKRTKVPVKKYLQKSACAGRLACDTFSSAKEFLFGVKNYNLSSLAKSQLKMEHENIDVNTIPEKWSKTETLLEVIQHCEQDALLTTQLLFKLQILPLTKQLTCLCGNLWQESLNSQRALRNEYLLLHEFHKNHYIVPEKFSREEKENMGIIKKRVSKGRRKKAEYAGGLVLEPKAGYYDTYILLLDFNSLYPSIVQEYNLCFSTVPHHHGQFEEKEIQTVFEENPYEGEEGLLPQVITRLLSSRKRVKGMMKAERNPALKKSLDIKQRAYKLVANSMYGCLGFSASRFYCKPIAALITALGRKNLQKAADSAVDQFPQLDVVYGDTDSIMVNTGIKSENTKKSMGQAISFAHQIKNKLNKSYRKMYLELDDVFAKFHILKKKKYAAVKAELRDGKITYTNEWKGLDLVRRDWAQLSSEMGKIVLNLILTSSDMDETCTQIQEYLCSMHEQMQTMSIPLKKYQITKQLTKRPEDYKAGTKLPHVECAKKMREIGMAVNVGDFIEYIVVEGNEDVNQRSYHISQMEAGNMTLDLEWYLKHQIIPPIVRLLEPIQQLTASMIGECFDVQISNPRNRGQTNRSNFDAVDFVDEDDLYFDSEKDKFAKCDPLYIKCRYCEIEMPYLGVLHPITDKIGFKCQNSSCPGYIKSQSAGQDIAVYKKQIKRQFDFWVKKYYGRQFWCDGGLDTTDCKHQLRRKGLGLCQRRKCPPPCHGLLKETYSAAQLNKQLDYFAYLLDKEKAEDIFDRKQRDAKIDKSKIQTISDIYKKANVEVAHLKTLCKYAGDLKLHSTYAIVKTKSVFESFIPRM